MTNLRAFYISIFKSEEGFSLVEMAVVLVIIGVVLGLSLPFLQTQTERSILKKTRDRQEQIYFALKSYQQGNLDQCLPCPADPKAKPDLRGHANCQNRSLEGIVPYKTLGLSEKVAKDGYGHFFTYGVEHNLTRRMDDFHKAKGGNLSVVDDKGYNVLDTKNKTNFIAIILISHGPSGMGAYTSKGTRIPITSKIVAKKLNGDGTPKYQQGGSEDDVYWVSQNQFKIPLHPH